MTAADAPETGPEPEPDFAAAPVLPAAFHAPAFKQRLLAVLSGLAAAVFLRAAIRGPQGPEAVSEAVLWAAGTLFLAAAVVLWRVADDRRPMLVIGQAGLEDRLYGNIPWGDVRRYRLHASLFNPGFGYDLRPGVRPPRNAGLYRAMALMNRSSGLPQRTFRKQMIVGGAEPMLLAARAARPDLEGA